MLPTHRSPTTSRTDERGWRSMVIDNEHFSSRILSFLRPKPTRFLARIIPLVFVGTLVLSWFVLSQLGPPHFLRGRLPPLSIFEGDEDELEWRFGKGPNADWPARAARVRQSFLHAYHGYEAYAAPRDELLPLSNLSTDKYVSLSILPILVLVYLPPQLAHLS